MVSTITVNACTLNSFKKLGIRMKPQCCRQPNIKPFKLRRAVRKIASKHQGWNTIILRHEVRVSRLASVQLLLKEDPCCLPGPFLYEKVFLERMKEYFLEERVP
jgi:hypothetical protein